MRYALLAGGLVLTLSAPTMVWSGENVAQHPNRDEIKQLDSNYERRLRAVEERLAGGATDPAPTVPTSRIGAAARAFNPAISAILMGNYWGFSRDPDDFALPGFQLGGEAGLAEEGPSLDESELTLSANVDDRFYGQLTMGLHAEGEETEVEIEEAFGEILDLPVGLGVRFGRFFSAVGHLNELHGHAWDFADAPLAYEAFLGEQLVDDGVQARWLAPTDRFVEFGVEALRGKAFPGGDGSQSVGAWDLFLHLGDDVGASHSWRLGISHLRSDAEERESGSHGHSNEAHDGGIEASLFAGDSDLTVVDLVWKWAPSGNPAHRNLVAQGGYFHRNEEGTVSVDEGAETTDYDGTQQGIYIQAAYQFVPRWRAGLRYDRLWSDNAGSEREVLTEAGLVDPDDDPERYSVMIDYSHSEFSRLRLQYNRDESQRSTNHAWTLQYILSLGAHGAHPF